MKFLFNDSTYQVETVEDAISIIEEYCIENPDIFYDDPHKDNGDLVIDLFEIDVDDEGTPMKTYCMQAVIRDED